MCWWVAAVYPPDIVRPAERLAIAALGKRECNATNAELHQKSVSTATGVLLALTNGLCTCFLYMGLHSCIVCRCCLGSAGDGCHCNKQQVYSSTRI
jgi:hypothetical protein